jgi:hypothetical protein
MTGAARQAETRALAAHSASNHRVRTGENPFTGPLRTGGVGGTSERNLSDSSARDQREPADRSVVHKRFKDAQGWTDTTVEVAARAFAIGGSVTLWLVLLPLPTQNAGSALTDSTPCERRRGPNDVAG